MVKWRYDLLANYQKFESCLIDTMTRSSLENCFFTDVVWAKENNEILTNYDLYKNIENKILYLNDLWWITNSSINETLSKEMYSTFVKNMHFDYGGHHWFFLTIKDLNIPIITTDKIQEILIRFPETIPEDFHLFTNKYYYQLQDENFNKKEKSDFWYNVKNHHLRSMYHTTKFFNFY